MKSRVSAIFLCALNSRRTRVRASARRNSAWMRTAYGERCCCQIYLIWNLCFLQRRFSLRVRMRASMCCFFRRETRRLARTRRQTVWILVAILIRFLRRNFILYQNHAVINQTK
jgi:hypothetical protein